MLPLVSPVNKRQKTVALSSTEAEYMAMSSAVCDILWTQQMATELERNFEAGTDILCDNESAEKLALSDGFRPRTKDIDIRFHHIRQKIDEKVINIMHVPSEHNVADALTKALTKEKHAYCTKGMGLMSKN